MSTTPRTLRLADVDASWEDVTLTGNRLIQDSRQLSAGDVFVAMGSTGTSGHGYVATAVSANVSAIVVDEAFLDETRQVAREAGFSGTLVGIPELFHDLGRLADAFWGSPSAQLNITGVTGTNGKTSVVQLLVQAWNELGYTSASIGTLGAGVHGEQLVSTGLTTPSVCQVHELLAGFVAAGVTHVGIEASSHALEQGRVAGVQFDQLAFTNLTRDHLDFHGTMEAYAASKEKIFDLSPDAHFVVNLDDATGLNFFNTYLDKRSISGVSSAAHAQASITAHNVSLTATGLAFDLEFDDENASVSSHLVGRFNVDNLLLTAGIMHAAGVTSHRIVEALPQLVPVFGRMNRLQPTPGSPLVIIDYAHTSDALRQALEALQDYDFTRIITVFGCTGDRDTAKRPEMAQIAQELSQLVIVTDDDVHDEDGDAILDEIRTGFTSLDNVVELRDRGDALSYAISEATTGDVVFIAGKGHEEFLIIGQDKVPFSDTSVATELLQRKAAGTL